MNNEYPTGSRTRILLSSFPALLFAVLVAYSPVAVKLKKVHMNPLLRNVHGKHFAGRRALGHVSHFDGRFVGANFPVACRYFAQEPVDLICPR